MALCRSASLVIPPQAHEGEDLTNYGALGPFVRSFILLVDPGDNCPPHYCYMKTLPMVNIHPIFVGIPECMPATCLQVFNLLSQSAHLAVEQLSTQGLM
jgi:hypothetical protein